MKRAPSFAAQRAIRTIVAIALVALSGQVAPAKAEVERTSIAQTPAIMPFLAAYIAEDANIWRDNGLDVKVIYLDGVATMNAVIAGSADFALSSSAALTRAAAHGQRLLALAAINNQAGQITVLRKELAVAAHFDATAPLPIRARVLQGRVIAAGGVGSVADVFLRTIAKAGGVDQSALTISPIGAFEVLAAFSRGAVDGFSYSLPYPLQAVHDGTAVIVADGTNGEPKDLFPLAAGLLVTRPQLCAEHRSLCEKMAHSIVIGTKFLLERKPEAQAILKKRFPNVDDAVLASAFDAVTRMTQSPPSISLVALENGDRMNAEAGFLKPEDKVPSYDGLFTNEFLH
jgi:NitT/TauT family transport system substrate-binding protein